METYAPGDAVGASSSVAQTDRDDIIGRLTGR
jgi:hypothetical protein